MSQNRKTRDAEFIADALAARKHVQETGIAYTAEDVHDYILSIARGENPSEPESISFFNKN